MRIKLLPIIALAGVCALVFATIHDLAHALILQLKPHFVWLFP